MRQHSVADGRPDHVTPRDEFVDIVSAIWHESRRHRDAIHRSTLTTRCDLAIDVARPGAPRLDGSCPCRDFLVDMLVEAYLFLGGRADTLRNPVGAARVHVRTRAAGDWIRRRRSDLGAQARTDRIRDSVRARTLPTDFHRALLEYLVDEAGSMAPLENHDELLHRLATRCAAEFGGPASTYLRDVAAGVGVVERACRAGPRVNAGSRTEPDHVTWWERYIERPLGRRPRRGDVAILPATGDDRGCIDLPSPRVEQDLEHAADSTADTAIELFADAITTFPHDPPTALRTGVRTLVARGLLSRTSAESFIADRDRFSAAARELSAMPRHPATG